MVFVEISCWSASVYIGEKVTKAIIDAFKMKETHLKQFWIIKLEVKENQFTKTTIIKSVLKKADLSKGNNYRGILRVKVRRGNALKNRILGAIDHISRCI